MSELTSLTKKLFARIVVTIGRGQGHPSKKQEAYDVFIKLDGTIIIPHLFEYETNICSFAINTEETYKTFQTELNRIAPLKEFNGYKKIL